MRLKEPRFAPLSDADLPEEGRGLLDQQRGRSGRVLNIFRTLARAPDALKAFLGWGEYILSDRNPLPAREREIAIMRVAWLTASGYEWTQHHRIALRCGVSADELEAVKHFPGTDIFGPADRAVLEAVDALVKDHFIPDPAWRRLSEAFSPAQCMGLVMTVGQYVQVAMMLNTFGVQVEGGAACDPDLRR